MEIYVTLIGILIATCIGLLQWLHPIFGEKAQCRKKYFEIYRRLSSKIKPKDLLKERPYDHEYFQRKVDEEIETAFNSRGNILLVGQSLSGKTHAIYHALNQRKNICMVSILRCNDLEFGKFHAPFSFLPRIVIIDDLQRFVSKNNFFSVLEDFIAKKWQIIASCRSGVEFTQLLNVFSSNHKEISLCFNKQIEIGRISSGTGRNLAEKNHKRWGNIEFDGNIGSIFLPLSEMRFRYENLSADAKFILRAIKILYVCEIFLGNLKVNCSWLNNLLSTMKIKKK